MTEVTEERVDVYGGKYTVILRSDGSSDALRYGEQWPAIVHAGGIDNLHRALARDLIAARAARATNDSAPTAVWLVHAALPGLNVPFYIRSASKPTHEQINEVWLRKSKTPLKTPEEAMRLPLRDAYPAYTRVERVEIAEAAA